MRNTIGEVLAVVVAVLSVAFVYKVWNERQMTLEWHRNGQILGEIRDAIKSRSVR